MRASTDVLRGLLWSVAILTFSTASAATTSATVSGYVRTAAGEGVGAVRVEIVHQPSGTTATAVTAANGAFYQAGLRVGGPYDMRFTAPGYRGHELGPVTLKPGAQPPIAVILIPVDVEEVVVTASAGVSDRDLNNGVGSAYSADDIASQPSVTRDVLRTLLRDPLAQSAGEGNLSVGGVNPRFNGLAIDGSLQQDDFGLRHQHLCDQPLSHQSRRRGVGLAGRFGLLRRRLGLHRRTREYHHQVGHQRVGWRGLLLLSR